MTWVLHSLVAEVLRNGTGGIHWETNSEQTPHERCKDDNTSEGISHNLVNLWLTFLSTFCWYFADTYGVDAFQYSGRSGSLLELHCEAAFLLAWLQGQDSNPGAIVGIHCLVKGHLLRYTELEPGSSGQLVNGERSLSRNNKGQRDVGRAVELRQRALGPRNLVVYILTGNQVIT